MAFEDLRATCEALLPQVSGEFACRMDELVAPTRTGAEPRYDVEGQIEFRADGHVERYRELRATGPAADPQLGPADCAAHAVLKLTLPARPDALHLPLRVQYREGEAVTPAAAVLPDALCALTVPVHPP